jgi:hypothetical protein
MVCTERSDQVRRQWKTIAVVAAVAAVALSVVAVAYGATRASATAGRAVRGGACSTLMSNPKAIKAMQELRAEHQRDMQAWIGQYRSDPSSAEAEAALQKLREEHWSDMSGLFKRFGIKVPATLGPRGMMSGAGPGGCGGACGSARAAGAGQGTGYGGGMMSSGGGMMSGATY